MATEGEAVAYWDGSQVKDVPVPGEQAAVGLLAVYSVLQYSAHDAQSPAVTNAVSLRVSHSRRWHDVQKWDACEGCQRSE